MQSFFPPCPLAHVDVGTRMSRALWGSEFLWQVLGWADQNPHQERRAVSWRKAAAILTSPRPAGLLWPKTMALTRACPLPRWSRPMTVQQEGREAQSFCPNSGWLWRVMQCLESLGSQLRFLLTHPCSPSAWSCSRAPFSSPGGAHSLVNLFTR